MSFLLQDHILSNALMERRRLLTYLGLLTLASPLGGCLFLARLLVPVRFAAVARAGAVASGAGRLASLGRPAAIAHSARLYPALQNGQSLGVFTKPKASSSSADQLVGYVARDRDLLLLRNAKSADVLASRKAYNNVLHWERIDGNQVGESKYNRRWDEASHYAIDSRRAIGHDQIVDDAVVHYDAKSNNIGRSIIRASSKDNTGEILSSDELAADMEQYNKHPALCDPRTREALDEFRRAQQQCLHNRDQSACALQGILEDNYQNALKEARQCT